MKKQILTIAACVGMSAAAMAQDAPTSKNGYVVLPEAGDIAIQMDATPILNFALNAVNIMNNTGQTAQHPGYVGGFNQVLVGKYFMSETMAIRGKLAINTARTSTKYYTDAAALTPSTNQLDLVPALDSTVATGSRSVILGGGIEMRRGHNRLQGFYGGELLIGFGSSSQKNKYEVAYDLGARDSGYVTPGDFRLLSAKSGAMITLGVRGFAGVEYFILPKISIGAEFGWALGMTMMGKGKSSYEYFGFEPGSSATDPYAFEREFDGTRSGSSSGAQVDAGGASGLLGGTAAITATFHF
jgi:hypothetical protein